MPRHSAPPQVGRRVRRPNRVEREGRAGIETRYVRRPDDKKPFRCAIATSPAGEYEREIYRLAVARQNGCATPRITLRVFLYFFFNQGPNGNPFLLPNAAPSSVPSCSMSVPRGSIEDKHKVRRTVDVVWSSSTVGNGATPAPPPSGSPPRYFWWPPDGLGDRVRNQPWPIGRHRSNRFHYPPSGTEGISVLFDARLRAGKWPRDFGQRPGRPG